MSPVSLEAVYAPFVASLLGGGADAPADLGDAPADHCDALGDHSDAPDDGNWSVELVAAHVALNNELIAQVAEAVAAGQSVAYDNARAVDESELAALVREAGDRRGLARAVERSAGRLERARQALGDGLAGTPVHSVIRDGGAVVNDGPVPIGALIEGNAGFHLDLHHDQLRALQPVPTSEPPADFDVYELVLLVPAENQPDLDEEARAALLRLHLGHFAKMLRAGFMVASGPIDGSDEIAGICLYRVGSVETARRLAEDDPAVKAGRFVVRVMSWYTAQGALPVADPP